MKKKQTFLDDINRAANDRAIFRTLNAVDEVEQAALRAMRRRLARGAPAGFGPEAAEQWKAAQQVEQAAFHREATQMIADFRRQLLGMVEETVLDCYTRRQTEEAERTAAALPEGSSLSQFLTDTAAGVLNTTPAARRFAASLSGIAHDFEKATYSMFRNLDDLYRETIQRSALLYSSGQKTIFQCIDEAQKDFLDKGVFTVKYRNGARVGVREYSEMALRTHERRASIAAEASVREYTGQYTVLVSSHALTCPKCAAWQGRVLADDVNQSPPAAVLAKYPRLSTAIAEGLLHPNCRHILHSFNPGIDKAPAPKAYTEKDAERYADTQAQRALERDIRKQKRKLAAAQDPANRQQAAAAVRASQKRLRDFIRDPEHPDRERYLIRQYSREKI